MRRTLLVLPLAALATLLLADSASAQRRGGGARGGTGVIVTTPNFSFSTGNTGYYRPGYSNYGNSPYNSAWGGNNYGRYQPAVGLSIRSGYFAQPGYYYAEPSYAVPATSYAGPAASQGVTLRVIVPTADTQVWFGDTPTTQQGTERLFESPPLAAYQTFTYTLTARWMENGQPVERRRHVNVQGGQQVLVNFMDPSAR